MTCERVLLLAPVFARALRKAGTLQPSFPFAQCQTKRHFEFDDGWLDRSTARPIQFAEFIQMSERRRVVSGAKVTIAELRELRQVVG